jgi:hypothetical protein
MGATKVRRTTEDEAYLHLHYKPTMIRNVYEDPRNDAIRANKCVQIYLSTLRKSNGQPSRNTYSQLLCATRRFLEFHGIESTDHTLDDLIDTKVNNPTDMSHERMVRLFQARWGNQMASMIVGLYHRNFADLRVHIRVSSNHKTIPLSEPQLLAIYNDPKLSEEHRLIIDLMAFAGERINALSMTEPKNVYLVEGTESALIDIEAHLNKTDTGHPCVIPKELAERILENSQRHGYKTLFPNYRSLFQHITRVAKKHHSVRFTSHYLRKRFQTVGSSTSASDMSPNRWSSLMGDTPPIGHLPTIYELMENKETVKQYEEFLAPRLKLGQRLTKSEPMAHNLEKENAELRRRLDRLIGLFEEKLGAIKPD